MSIIQKIREQLKLDKAVLSLDRNFTDSVGLFSNEVKELYQSQQPSMDCLGQHYITDNHQPDFFYPFNITITAFTFNQHHFGH